MDRIPRPGCRDVVFFLHGALDTSLSWVSGGVTGSQAFSAWEAGFDVWLGNTRCTQPRLHAGARHADAAWWKLGGEGERKGGSAWGRECMGQGAHG
eukprot:159470-Chlamydomonas_euryale.AAC.3